MGLQAPGRQQAGVVAAAPRGVGFGAGWTGQARLTPREGESPRRCWLQASRPSRALPSWEGLPPAGTQSPFRTHRFRPVGASATLCGRGLGHTVGGPSGAPHPFSGPQTPPQGGQGEGLSVGGPPEGPARTGCWPGSLPPFEAGSSPRADAAGSWAPLGAHVAQARLHRDLHLSGPTCRWGQGVLGAARLGQPGARGLGLITVHGAASGPTEKPRP